MAFPLYIKTILGFFSEKKVILRVSHLIPAS